MLDVRSGQVVAYNSIQNLFCPGVGTFPPFSCPGRRFRVSALGLFYSAFLRPVSAEDHKTTCADISQTSCVRSVTRFPVCRNSTNGIYEFDRFMRTGLLKHISLCDHGFDGGAACRAFTLDSVKDTTTKISFLGLVHRTEQGPCMSAKKTGLMKTMA